MAWTKVEPYQGTIHHGCLNCGGTHDVAPMDMLVAVGFGYAAVTRDGHEVYQEDINAMLNSEDDDEALPTLEKFEAMAKADPDHDWRVVLHGPLRGREYQRHGEAHWVLIDSNQGFA